MPVLKNIILSSTIHDPDLKFKNLINPVLSLIKEFFETRIVCCTPVTNDALISFLLEEGFIVIKGEKLRQFDIYKLAIEHSLKQIKDPNLEKIFYIDFDRLIHWLSNYPNELAYLLEKNNDVDYLHIGRTTRAFETHPSTQKDTEGIINEIGSRILGFSEKKDIISVCFLISKALGECIIEMKNETATGFYSSWPIIFWNLAESKRYVEVEGLEWETPDQFKEEIDEQGYQKWLKNFQSAEEWKKRVTLLHEGLLEFYRLTDFKLHDIR
ncbi:MAG: hypothetical protein EU535_00460 [Promethearchaeota archaeon]|nr:MAG: hypothetical protein EU535_00460 [Candidatus Lokiarchaeota archaeon]